MIRFAALLANLPHGLQAYLAASSAETRSAALSLLQGKRPKRLLSLDDLSRLATDTAQIPDFLFAASLAASGDRAEVAALILPPPILPAPDLPTLLTDLHQLGQAPTETRRAAIRHHWQSLPPSPRLIYNRLITGTFRATLPPEITPREPRQINALLTLVELANPILVTLALPQGNQLIPIARLPLPPAHARQILAFTLANTIAKFGPVRSLPTTQVFQITFHGTTPNPRRKSRLDLITPEITAWCQDLSPDQATPLSDLAAPHP